MPTAIQTQHFDGFQIDTYSDGTYGFMTDGGQHKEGYKSKDGAKKMATKLAAKEPKGPQVLKSEDKGGYVINTFSDGTYGYLMPDGTYKNGYKSKDGAGKAGKKLAAKAAKAQAGVQVELLEKQAQGAGTEPRATGEGDGGEAGGRRPDARGDRGDTPRARREAAGPGDRGGGGLSWRTRGTRPRRP